MIKEKTSKSLWSDEWQYKQRDTDTDTDSDTDTDTDSDSDTDTDTDTDSALAKNNDSSVVVFQPNKFGNSSINIVIIQ